MSHPATAIQLRMTAVVETVLRVLHALGIRRHQRETPKAPQAVIYLRFAQPESVALIKGAEKMCRARAAELGLPVRIVHIDIGSARPNDLVRVDLQNAFEALQPGDVLLTPSLDRITRQHEMVAHIMTTLAHKQAGLEFLPARKHSRRQQ